MQDEHLAEKVGKIGQGLARIHFIGDGRNQPIFAASFFFLPPKTSDDLVNLKQ